MISFTDRRGQALLLVTLSLFAMCGLLGLAVDLGWSYFVKKSAQNAADSAALAAAYQALNIPNGESATPFPSPGASSGDCDGVSSNLLTGCQYAEQNDFSPGGHGGRQRINMTADQGPVLRQDGTTVQSCAPPAVIISCVEYRVTVRTAETIPQLFSAVLGNATGISSARSTAGVVQAPVNGSIIALNRSDPNPGGPYPTGVSVTSGTAIGGVSGVVIASNSPSAISGAATPPIIARKPVANPYLADGPQFLDPLRGYGQPPLPTTPLTVYAVMSGNLGSTIYPVQGFDVNGAPLQRGSALPSGIYFSAVCATGCTNSIPSTISPQVGALTIGPGSTISFSNGAFGSFFFFGGLNVLGQMQMDPGEYVIVGGGAPGSLQVSGGNAGITATNSGGAGEIIVLTGSSSPFKFNSDGTNVTGNTNGDLYPGLMAQMNGPSTTNLALMELASLNGALAFGPANIQTSLGNVPSANPSGLNPGILNSLGDPYPAYPANLQPFGGIVLWQDQANSSVQYTADGNVGCGGGISNPCPRTSVPPVTATSPQLTLPGAAIGLNGIIYQPRGAWITISNGGTLTGSLQIITGAVAGGSINILQPPAIPLRRRVVALIE